MERRRAWILGPATTIRRAELSDAPGTFLVRAVHDETRGWQWVTEPL